MSQSGIVDANIYIFFHSDYMYSVLKRTQTKIHCKMYWKNILYSETFILFFTNFNSSAHFYVGSPSLLSPCYACHFTGKKYHARTFFMLCLQKYIEVSFKSKKLEGATAFHVFLVDSYLKRPLLGHGISLRGVGTFNICNSRNLFPFVLYEK